MSVDLWLKWNIAACETNIYWSFCSRAGLYKSLMNCPYSDSRVERFAYKRLKEVLREMEDKGYEADWGYWYAKKK